MLLEQHVKNRPLTATSNYDYTLYKTNRQRLYEWEKWYGELVARTQALRTFFEKETSLRKQIIEDPFIRLECQIEIGMRNARRNWKRQKKKGIITADEDFKHIVTTKWIPIERVLAILEKELLGEEDE